jgi:hypothetical protein
MRNGYTKQITRKQADLSTLELAWLYYLPNAIPPLLPHVCHWLKRAPIALLLELVQRAASERVQQPRQWIFNELKKFNATEGNHANH